MNPLINSHHAELKALCQRYRVKRLELFGSGASDDFNPETSDLDFLVEFYVATDLNPADQYFGLWEALKQLFQRDVDLVTVRSLRNPYFIESVNKSRQMLYAA